MDSMLLTQSYPREDTLDYGDSARRGCSASAQCHAPAQSARDAARPSSPGSMVLAPSFPRDATQHQPSADSMLFTQSYQEADTMEYGDSGGFAPLSFPQPHPHAVVAPEAALSQPPTDSMLLTQSYQRADTPDHGDSLSTQPYADARKVMDAVAMPPPTMVPRKRRLLEVHASRATKKSEASSRHAPAEAETQATQPYRGDSADTHAHGTAARPFPSATTFGSVCPVASAAASTPLRPSLARSLSREIPIENLILDVPDSDSDENGCASDIPDEWGGHGEQHQHHRERLQQQPAALDGRRRQQQQQQQQQKQKRLQHSQSGASVTGLAGEEDCGRRYTLRLDLYEEWVAARLLVILAEAERGENLVRCRWSERGFLTDQGYDFLVPNDWLEDLPRTGVFEFTYVTERPAWISWTSRRELAERFCGWEPL